nr:hypothetical protein [Tanacetum cinerariifolium]
MNYVLVVTGNQINGTAGTKEKLFTDAKDSAEDVGKKAPKVDVGEASDNGEQDNQVSKSKDGSLFQQDRHAKHNNSTTDINTVSLPVECISLPHVPMVTPIDDTRIFGNAYDDVLEEEVAMNNVDSSYAIPEATKFLKDHAKDSAEDVGKKAPKVDVGEASDNGEQDNQVSKSEDGSLFQQDRQAKHNNSTTDINTVSLPVECISLPHVPMVTPIDDTRIFGNAYDDDVLEEEVAMNNVDSSYAIPKATKFLKDRP